MAVALARFVIVWQPLESVPPLCAKAAIEENERTAAITRETIFIRLLHAQRCSGKLPWRAYGQVPPVNNPNCREADERNDWYGSLAVVHDGYLTE